MLLKGNTHTHTTRSDGDLTPEEIIQHYQKLDYDFLFLTDHNDTLRGVQRHGDLIVFGGTEISPDPEDPNTYILNNLSRMMAGYTYDDVLMRDFIQEIGQHYCVVGLPDTKETLHILAHPQRYEHNCHPQDVNAMVKGWKFDATEITSYGEPEWKYLNKSWPKINDDIPLISSDDAHEIQEISDGFTVVEAAEKTPRAIVNAIRDGKTFPTGIEFEAEFIQARCPEVASGWGQIMFLKVWQQIVLWYREGIRKLKEKLAAFWNWISFWN